MNHTKLLIALLLLGLIVFTGCNTPNSKNPILNDPMANENLKDYKALTPEAQAIIDKMVRGEDVGRVLNGGGTPALMNSLRASQSGGTFNAEGMPSTQPNSPATRPKITVVMRMGGPAETYYYNYQGEISYINNNRGSWEYVSVSSKRWNNATRSIVTPYITVLFQDIYDDSHTNVVNQGEINDSGGYYQNYDIMAIDTFDSGLGSGRIMRTTVERRNIPDTSYIYQNIPGNSFEDPNGFPIRDTWYWNPPYHFDQVNWLIQNNGTVTYDAVTRPGAEQQMLIFRWTRADFVNAYVNPGGWKDQGWRIKDIDIENELVCALLTPGTYVEGMVVYQTDDYYIPWMPKFWNLGYRGVLIDSSW